MLRFTIKKFMSFLHLSSNAPLDLPNPGAVMRSVKYEKAHSVSFRMGFYVQQLQIGQTQLPIPTYPPQCTTIQSI